MLRFTGIAIILLSCLWNPTGAQTVVSQPSDYKLWKSPDLYSFGTDLLKQGKRLETAITTLSIATDRDPSNLDYQLALGCACASRLASLAYAQRMVETEKGTKYHVAVRQGIWNDTHTNPSSPLFGQVFPVAPLPPFTPDDGKPLELSSETLISRKRELSRKILAALRRAKRLAGGMPAERRTEADYLRGWGLILVRRFGKDVLIEKLPDNRQKNAAAVSPTDDDLLLPTQEIVDCFKACLQQAPARTVYWQSLALAYVPGFFDNIHLHDAYENQQPLNSRDRMEDAVDAMSRAVTVREQDDSPTRPKESELLYQLALLYAPTHPKEAAEYLAKLLLKQGGNSILWYLSAEQWFRCAEKAEEMVKESFFKKGLRAVEAGNQIANVVEGYITVPVPRLLAAGWNYQPIYNLSDAGRVVEALYGGLSDAAKWYKEKRDAEGMTNCALPLMQCGLLSIHTYAGRDMARSDPERYIRLHMRGFYGFCLCLRAYDFLKEANQIVPDDRRSALLAENATHYEYARAWDKAMTREVKIDVDK